MPKQEEIIFLLEETDPFLGGSKLWLCRQKATDKDKKS
jgi:hypothetical protein